MGTRKLWTATTLFDQDKNRSLVRCSRPSRHNTREGWDTRRPQLRLCEGI